MTHTAASLHHKIESAADLKGVVRTMKALAASSITQYETPVLALGDYYRTVELGLSASFRVSNELNHLVSKAALNSVTGTNATESGTDATDTKIIAAIVFGSDQGLVGQFNEDIAAYALSKLAELSKLPEQSSLAKQTTVIAVGERVQTQLSDHQKNNHFNMGPSYTVPTSVAGIAPLIGSLVEQIDQINEAHRSAGSIYVFHNRPTLGALYEPVMLRLLPLDQQWLQQLAKVRWPTDNPPEVFCPISKTSDSTISALIQEYLFISIFRACAESLASENASRLAAMQRAEKNIDELQEKLGREFNRLRQSAIDEELFDVVAGYELLAHKQ